MSQSALRHLYLLHEHLKEALEESVLLEAAASFQQRHSLSVQASGAGDHLRALIAKFNTEKLAFLSPVQERQEPTYVPTAKAFALVRELPFDADDYSGRPGGGL